MNKSDYRPRLPKDWEGVIEEMKNFSLGEIQEVAKILRSRGKGEEMSVSTSAKSLDELFDIFSLDKDQWTVIDSTINQYPTTLKVGETVTQVDNHQIKARIKPRIDIATPAELLKKIGDSYAAKGPSRRKIRRPKTSKVQTLELMITDHHLGKMPAGGSYSFDEARKLYMGVVHEAIERTSLEPISQINLVIGNDYLHIDNHNNTTTSGTQVESNARWQDLYQWGAQLLIEAIDTLSQVAPVRVIAVPGNHDYMSVVSLAYLLQAWYRNDENVQVGNPDMFQYFYDGTSLIGWTHGNIKMDRLPLIMAKESKDFHEAKITEWHVGHLHQVKSKSYPIAGERHEVGGVVVRVFPALCPSDAWHQKHGWHLSSKSSTAILYEQGRGQVAEYSIIPTSL